jgi:hypothetical protein
LRDALTKRVSPDAPKEFCSVSTALIAVGS